jgi:hypothetical protein
MSTAEYAVINVRYFHLQIDFGLKKDNLGKDKPSVEVAGSCRQTSEIRSAMVVLHTTVCD